LDLGVRFGLPVMPWGFGGLGLIIAGAGRLGWGASLLSESMSPVYPASCFPLFGYSVFVVLLCGIQYPWFAVRGSGFGLAWYGRPGAGGWWGRAGREAKK